jgi:hypothetical protein
MASTDRKNSASESTAPTATPLPKGYLWRLFVILVLLLGGAGCLIFYNSIIGSVLVLLGLAFGKISGLNEMVGINEKDKS